jgi:hypothetical protein
VGISGSFIGLILGGVLAAVDRRLVFIVSALLTGKIFFPQLISAPFHHGLVLVFSMAMGLLVIAAIASAFRGGRYVHEEHGVPPAEIPASASPDDAAGAQTAALARGAASDGGPASSGASDGGPASSGAGNGTAVGTGTGGGADSLAGTGQHGAADYGHSGASG